MVRSGRPDRGILVYPKQWLHPRDLLTFTEMSGFVDDWERMGLDVEFDLLTLQVQIMAHPKQGVVVPGTGALRKLEFAPPRGFGGHRKGKRGSCRVCYVYFAEFRTVLLVAAYPKNRQDDLSPRDKATAASAIARVRASLAARYQK